MKKKIMALLLACGLAAGTVASPVGTGSVQAAETSAKQPGNPVHHCTKGNGETDTTDWSYVYFGTYPQTEITGSDLTSAITGAAYDIDGDAWVDGIKYRRISIFDTERPAFCQYFLESEYRYFKWERIKWRVLQNNGSTLFVAADKGLDCKSYVEERKPMMWESSDLRDWLNSAFYSTAFGSAEQEAIVAQTVVNKDGIYGTEGGKDTVDKIYILSNEEASNPSYGFCDGKSESASRAVKASDYAYIRGASRVGSGECNWRLRTPGDGSDFTAYVEIDGRLNDDWGMYYYNDISATVPALHINLSSGCWLTEDDGTSGEQDIKVDTLSISADSKKIAAGQKVALNVTVLPDNATNSKVKWKSENVKYATVNSQGIVTTKKAGKGKKVKITAEATDGSGKKATIELKLMKNAVTKIQIEKVKNPLKAGKSITLKAKVRTNGKDANKTLKWSVSNEKYATVNAKGKVTAKKAGKGKTVTITAMSTDGTDKKAKVKIKIK